MVNDAYGDLRGFTRTANRVVDPQHVGKILSELIALKGLARVDGVKQLQEIWCTVVGREIERKTTVTEFNRGVLNVAVNNSALLGELNGFHKQRLLNELQQKCGHLKIRDIKFRLKTELK